MSMIEDHAVEAIQYEPHYKSVTEQGRHHFNRESFPILIILDEHSTEPTSLFFPVCLTVYLSFAFLCFSVIFRTC